MYLLGHEWLTRDGIASVDIITLLRILTLDCFTATSLYIVPPGTLRSDSSSRERTGCSAQRFLEAKEGLDARDTLCVDRGGA
jgi:hypothetical protein